MDNTDFNRLDGITKKYVDYRISGLTFSGGSGTSGTSGTSGGGTGSGSSGSSGTSGTSGTSGINGSSGTSGANGSSGSSGTSGVSGSSGSSGTSGVNGSSGSSGTSGVNGSSGSSGTSGANGSSGSSGTSGVNGSSGSSGTSGVNGSSGSSGTSGSSGSSPNQNLSQTLSLGNTTGTYSILFADGSVSLPSISFTNDTDTGIFRRSNLELNFTIDGTELLRLDADTAAAKLNILNNGTPTAVSLGINDNNTGLYRPATDQLGVAAGGLTAAVFGSTNSTISSLSTGRVRTDNGILSNYTETGCIGITIDGSGSAITTGLKNYITIPFNCQILGWTIISDVSGSIVIDVWKDTYGNYPPTVADSIAGTEKPTLSSQNKNQDNTLTTWNTSVNEGDILAFNVDSASTITKINLTLKINK